MVEQIYNVLFLCTGNSARSILALGAKLKEIGQIQGATTSRSSAA